MFRRLFFPHDHKADHTRALDGLRGLAILFVMLSHSGNRGYNIAPFIDFSHAGKFGVYLFFVLSAYLLNRQITLALTTGKAGKGFWMNYFLRRFLRIYPLFIIALLVHGLLTTLGFTTVIDRPLDIPMHLMLLSGEYIFWSIPVEFKYYFISPLFLWIFHRYFRWDIGKVTISLIMLALVPALLGMVLPLPGIMTLAYFPIFLAGTTIAVMEVIKYKEPGKVGRRLLDLAGITAILLIFLGVPSITNAIFGTSVEFEDPAFYLPFGILWGTVLASARYGKKIMKRIFELDVLRFFGSISYSLYLFHIPVLKLLARGGLNIPDQFFVFIFIVASVLVATISYLLVERPLSRIRLKKLA